MKNLRKQLKKLPSYQSFLRKEREKRGAIAHDNIMLAKLRAQNRKHFSL
jgi:hypothetical protein